MKIVFFTAVVTLLCLVGNAQKRKVVFVIADGIPADVIEKVHTPNLDNISRIGQYMRAYVGGERGGYSETPTISAVSYNSLLTGTWVNKHNVWDNDIAAPNYHYWNIFRFLESQYPSKKTAIFSSWTDNRTKLIGEGLPAAGNIQLDYRYDGYELDTLKFPQDEARDFMHRIDQTVTDSAELCIRENGPDLSWIYLEYTDDIGHMYGDSPHMTNAVEKLDIQLGKIWQAIRERQKKYKEEWMIVVTTDHGRDEDDGKDHGGHTPRQRSTWIATNVKMLNTYARNYKPGIVDIMPTIARFLNIRISNEQLREIDGTPLIGDLSVFAATANLFQQKIDITWQSSGTGIAKIWVSPTNTFRHGGKDEYHLLAQVPVDREHAIVDVSKIPSDFYKIVIEGPSNMTNTWIVTKNDTSTTNP